jgi:hypothetical protein
MSMRAMSAQHIVQAWEQGHKQHDIDRALTILTLAYPDRSREELADLTIGQRDSQLLTLREMTFGQRLICFSVCPHCKERLQFSLTTEALKVGQPRLESPDLEFCIEGLIMRIRLPNSHDLAAVANHSATDEPHQVILQRCLVEVSRDGKAIDAKNLPKTAICAVSDQIVENDPQAEVLLELNCSSCGHRWKAAFDIVRFFWREITAYAKRLLEDVVVLSSAYGWREKDILDLSPVRRRFYLERAM